MPDTDRDRRHALLVAQRAEVKIAKLKSAEDRFVLTAAFTAISRGVDEGDRILSRLLDSVEGRRYFARKHKLRSKVRGQGCKQTGHKHRQTAKGSAIVDRTLSRMDEARYLVRMYQATHGKDRKHWALTLRIFAKEHGYGNFRKVLALYGSVTA